MNQFANICLKILHLYLWRMLLLFSCPVMSNSLWPKWLQYTRPICPSHLPKFAQVHVHCISDAVQPSHPLTPFLFLPSIFPSIRDFSSESAVLIRWSKYWSFSFSFSFSISPSDEYSGLISLKIDWFDCFAVQGLSGVFSSTSVRRHWFFLGLPSLWSVSHNCSWPLGRLRCCYC